jgi:hypothetical protein
MATWLIQQESGGTRAYNLDQAERIDLIYGPHGRGVASTAIIFPNRDPINVTNAGSLHVVLGYLNSHSATVPMPVPDEIDVPE